MNSISQWIYRYVSDLVSCTISPVRLPDSVVSSIITDQKLIRESKGSHFFLRFEFFYFGAQILILRFLAVWPRTVRQRGANDSNIPLLQVSYFMQQYPNYFYKTCVARMPRTCVNLLKPTGHETHKQFNIQQLYVLPTLYLCVFLLIWEQTVTSATYIINSLVFTTEMESVYCAVRTGSLNKAVCAS